MSQNGDPHSVSSPRIKAQQIAGGIKDDVQTVLDVINEKEKSNFRLGVALLVVAIGSWMIGLELVNTVLKGDSFPKPLFLATLTGSCFSLNLLPEVISGLAGLFKGQAGQKAPESPLLSTSELGIDPDADNNELHELSDVVPLTRHEVAVLALQLAGIYFFYNCMVFNGLKFTSASNSTILGSTTTFFTLFLGVFLKIDHMSYKKVVCVCSSLLGVVLISYDEKQSTGDGHNIYKPKNPLLGNAFALVGAFFYALYLIQMKVKCGGKKTTNERVLFGCVGLFTMVLGPVVLFVAHLTGLEPFELPPNATVAAMITINAVFSVISDYSTILAMLLTSPLVTSLSLTSSIPITILIDFVVLHVTGSGDDSDSNLLTYGFGVACILTSVILININLTSENEFIEEVIEQTLQDAIVNDEILSPVLSPYLGAMSTSTQTPRSYGFSGVSLRPFSSRKKTDNSELESSRFALNATSSVASEHTPLQNANHDRSLYNIDSRISDVNPEEPQRPQLLVYGGVNHSFVVKSVDAEQ